MRPGPRRMKIWREFRAIVALLLAATLACPPARALVTFNDSHDHIYVTGTFGLAHDSNIFASHDSQGDFVYTANIVAEYTRRAGWIGINANVAVSASRYGKVKGEDFNNPSYGLELTKQTGRTTGSFTLNVARSSRADAAVNLRTSSWNYNAGLNYAYPIVNRLKLSGTLGYAGQKYIGDTPLANLGTYTANTSLFYMLSGERDLVGGYRYRYSQTSLNTATTDHAVSLGLNGRIIRGINGSVNLGYQLRVPSGVDNKEPRFSAVTASAATSYAVTRKISLSAQASKDFSTTATGASVDTTSANLTAEYAYNSHWSFSASTGGSDSRFLGESGRVVISSGPPILYGPSRHDNSANWNASLLYSRSEHLKISFGYGWSENWSTIAFADFIRTNWNLNLSSRW